MFTALSTPKVQLAITLVLISLTALNLNPLSKSLYLLLTSLGLTVFFDLLFTYIRSRKFFVPYAAIVSGLIIGLLIDPSAQLYQIATYAALAMVAKNFLRISNRHVFNPASLGLLIGGIIFGQFVTWWGTSHQNVRELNLQSLIFFLVLLTPLYVSAYKLKRYYSIITFLLAYTILSHITAFSLSIDSVISRLLDPVTLFFAAVMLPEPITSPVNQKRQILYGLVVALFAALLSSPPVSNSLLTNGLLPDVFIISLLIGNLLFFKLR